MHYWPQDGVIGALKLLTLPAQHGNAKLKKTCQTFELLDTLILQLLESLVIPFCFVVGKKVEGKHSMEDVSSWKTRHGKIILI